MTNREKYKEKRDAYDMMMTIWGTGACPIRVIGGESCLPRYLVCKAFDEDCPACIQKWLNQEADQPKPQWQDAMMKNFLRKE